MSKIQSKYTLEEREDLLLKPCKTKAELKAWIKYHLGLDLPDQTVSRYADTNPFDVIWEVYDICVNKNNPEDIKDLLYVAGRGSGKTLGMAIAELLVLLHDQRDVAHVGAIMAQAERCYNYQKGFLYNRKIKDIALNKAIPEDQRILEKANMSKSIFNIKGEKATLEVLPCTLKSCNGPHVSLVVVDEIDTVSGESVKAYAEISGMIDSRGDKKALRVGISTRKSRYGLMNKQIENAEKEGRTVRRWTGFEFTERCPDSRSGTKPMTLYTKQDAMETITEEEFNRKPLAKQKEYLAYEGFDGCAKCPAFPICLTDAKRQKCKSFMLKPIGEIIQKVRTEGPDWALAQLMNLKPSVEGIVFREYEERLHVKNWNEMWRILTGTEFPGECTHDIFVKKCNNLKLPCYGGVDWGFTSPNTVVYFYVDKRENIYVVRTDGITLVSQATWINYIKSKYHNMYNCQLYCPDVADQGAVQEMKNCGLPVASRKDKESINTGIQVIKKWLKMPGSPEPKIFFAAETTKHIQEEFTLYHYKTDAAGMVSEVPDTEHDHWLDALKYPMVVLFARSNLILSGDDLSFDKRDDIVASNGTYIKPPTPEEYAEINHIQSNMTDQNLAKLGQIGKASELLHDANDDEIGSSGGFLFTF